MSLPELNSTTDLCEEAEGITDTFQMKVILVLECIFGVVALFPNVLNVVLLYRAEVFHLNLRVLLAHLSFDVAFYSFFMAQKAFVRLLTPYCSLPVSFRTCVMRDWAFTIPLHNAMLALLILLLERAYCTIRLRTYDGTWKKPYLAGGLLVCAWMSTLSIQYSTFIKVKPELIIPICETSLYIGRNQVMAIAVSFISVETLTTLLMLFLYTYTRLLRRRMLNDRAKFDLAARFQVEQNMRLNAALWPSALLHELCYIPNYTFLLCTMVDRSAIPTHTRAWFFHLTCLWRIMYACIHPILLICINPNLKRGLYKTAAGAWIRKVFRFRKVENMRDAKESCLQATGIHFDYLKNMWYPHGKTEQKKTQIPPAGNRKSLKPNGEEAAYAPQVAWARNQKKEIEPCEDAESAVRIKL